MPPAPVRPADPAVLRSRGRRGIWRADLQTGLIAQAGGRPKAGVTILGSALVGSALLVSMLFSAGSGRVFAAQTSAARISASQKPALSAPAPEYASVRVPGRVAALLSVAGLDPSTPRTIAIRQIVHVAHGSRESADEALLARRARLIQYLESISSYERVSQDLAGKAPGIGNAQNRDVRRVLERLAEALGCELKRTSNVYRLVPDSGGRQSRLRDDLRIAGLELDALLKQINAGEQAGIALPADDAPLPLDRATWLAVLRATDALSGSLVTAILGNRQAALLYAGLLGTDGPTSEFFETHRELLEEILGSDRAAILAAHGQRIQVGGGRVLVPGGTSAEPLWEALVDEPVTRPDRFISKLLSRDGGRAALLFDTAAQADPAHLDLLLGTGIGSTSARRDRFRQLYDLLGAQLAGWNPAEFPFSRTLYDPSHILAMTPVDDRGLLTGPLSLRLWRKALERPDLPADPAAEMRNPAAEGAVDLPWFLERLAEVGPSRTLRRSFAETWAFGHRVFAGASDAMLPDMLVTLRGFTRYQVLVAALERMGVRDPAVYAAAITKAESLARLGDAGRTATALALYQGALALIDRARAARTIEPADAEQLVRRLAALPVTEDGNGGGAIGQWMRSALLPTLAARLPPGLLTEPEPSAESVVLTALSGRLLSMADSPDLAVWHEGLTYSVDLAAAGRARLQAVREKQSGVPFDASLALGRAAWALTVPGVTLAGLPSLVSGLESAARTVQQAAGTGPTAWLDQQGFRKRVASAVNDVKKIKKANDLRKLPRIAGPLLAESDYLLGEATLSLAYAAYLPDPDGPELLDRDPALRHDWGVRATQIDGWVPNAWQLPKESPTGGWHLEGAILGADLALAPRALRRVSIDRVPLPASLAESEVTALARSAALANAFDLSDADRESVTSALRRGRQRLAAVTREPAGWPAAADAMGIRDFRRDLLAWTIAHEPAEAETLLSLGDLVRLGALDGAVNRVPDAWGTDGSSFDGRWSLRYPDPCPLDMLSGRKGGALTIACLPDMALTLADAMEARRVPAVLTPAVMECAAQDLIDDLRLDYEGDWIAVVRQARRAADRLDEYLASLTSGGPLIPVSRSR